MNGLWAINSSRDRLLTARERPDEEPILKPTLILATALFLMFAPDPDSQVIAEVTSNLIAPASQAEFTLPD